MASIHVGDQAPDFSAIDQQGKMVTLSALWTQGPVVLYFYPKDNTPGCTAQACAFRDAYEIFRDAGAIVVGISSDSEDSHRAFATKHTLAFTLVSDVGGEVRKRFGVAKTLGIFPGRVTYVIDQQGIVQDVFSSQRHVAHHVDRAVQKIQKMQGC